MTSWARSRSRRREHVVERDVERDVQRHGVHRRTDPPQPEHRTTALADPQERCIAFRELERDGQPDDVPIERDRARHVAHGQMRLEQPAYGVGRAHGAGTLSGRRPGPAEHLADRPGHAHVVALHVVHAVLTQQEDRAVVADELRDRLLSEAAGELDDRLHDRLVGAALR